MRNCKKHYKKQILCILLIIIFIVILITCHTNQGYLMRNTVWGWGDNYHGQLGNANINQIIVPVQTDLSNVPGDIIDISAGYYYTLAVNENGEVWAWGNNSYGLLGNGTNYNTAIPIQTNMTTMPAIIDIASGVKHSLALDKNGDVWAWGDNYYGQLGNASTTDSSIPVKTDMTTMPAIVDIASGVYHSLALDENREVWAWGDNYFGQLGNGSTTNSSIPVKTDMTTMPAINDIACGDVHSIALDENGDVWAWGENSQGQLGNGSTTNSSIPVKTDMTTVPAIVDIACGGFHSIALDENGDVWAWGNNSYGQLGDGSTTNSSIPVKTDMTTMPAIIDIAAGEFHSLALDKNGDVWAWGDNSTGQLGNASKSNRDTPVKVHNISRITDISGGRYHSIAIQQANPYIWILIVIGAILLYIYKKCYHL